MPGDDRPDREDDVALALVDADRIGHLVALPPEPVHVRVAFLVPLRMPEPGAEHLAVDHGRAVRREHHVGQAGHRVDDAHRVAQALVGLP